jgi:hypothetical protein
VSVLTTLTIKINNINKPEKRNSVALLPDQLSLLHMSPLSP